VIEQWDIRDKDGITTGKVVNRGEVLDKNEYHLVVHIWLFNSEGQMLIQKRSQKVKFAPNMWSVAGGCALRGEKSVFAACRELNEELGVHTNPGVLVKKGTYLYVNSIIDIWSIKFNVVPEINNIQIEEVSEIKWVVINELKGMIQEGAFFDYGQGYFKFLDNC
jgi:isopentenyldiphosphate isomerase